MFTSGNGIYIYNKLTNEYKYYCYFSNLDKEDYEKLKEYEYFIKYFNGEIIKI